MPGVTKEINGAMILNLNLFQLKAGRQGEAEKSSKITKNYSLGFAR